MAPAGILSRRRDPAQPSRFDSLLEVIPWPVIIVDENGRVVTTSGCPGPGGPAKTDLRELAPFYLSRLKGAQGWLAPQEVEVTRFSAEGLPIHERLIVRRVVNGGCIIVLDQTELRAAQVQALQTSRLAALGFMVAGVSHEISNPLASIHSIVQLMRSDPRDPGLMDLGLENISQNVKRILEISRRLVNFSRVADEPREPLPMDEAVADAICAMREVHELDCIRLSIAPDPQAIVLGHPGQLREVLLNLLTNAVQAMNGRGTISVRTQRLLPGTVRVTVADEGPGVPGRLAEKVFEPFFTTKPPGAGTGLGLAVSKHIVEEHAGRLWLEESQGPGATFHLELPGCSA